MKLLQDSVVEVLIRLEEIFAPVNIFFSFQYANVDRHSIDIPPGKPEQILARNGLDKVVQQRKARIEKLSLESASLLVMEQI